MIDRLEKSGNLTDAQWLRLMELAPVYSEILLRMPNEIGDDAFLAFENCQYYIHKDGTYEYNTAGT